MERYFTGGQANAITSHAMGKFGIGAKLVLLSDSTQ